jgi:hypothetical protein
MGPRRGDDRWERWVQDALKGSHLRSPSAGALRKARALGSRLASGPVGGLQWLADLIFDSAAQPLPVGVRSARSGQRRLLYKIQSGSGAAERCELDLRVRCEPAGTIELTGQLLPPWARAHVEVSAGRTKRKKALGESGEFVIRGIPARAEALRLEIRGEDGEQLVVQEVPLFPSPAGSS